MARSRFWITRSQPGAERLATVLRAAGYPCLVSPVLTIAPLPAPELPAQLSLAVALSEHAVAHAPSELWARAAKVIAVGARTAQTLANQGVLGDIPRVASSEGLLGGPLAPYLANPSSVQAPVALVAGAGGRTVLRDGLQARGIKVLSLSVYERQTVSEAPDDLRFVRAIVVSSGDGFSAAGRLWCPGEQPADVPVFAPSQRVAALAHTLGFQHAFNCGGADPQSVLSCIRRELPCDESDE